MPERGTREALSAVEGEAEEWSKGESKGAAPLCGQRFRRPRVPKTALGGIGYTLPFLIPNFTIAFGVAGAVVIAELGTISWVRHRYTESRWISATLQAVIGGALVLAAGVLIGSS